jgi:hypothetical protein
VLVHRQPEGGRYAAVTVSGLSDTLQAEALPEVTIPVARIFV